MPSTSLGTLGQRCTRRRAPASASALLILAYSCSSMLPPGGAAYTCGMRPPCASQAGAGGDWAPAGRIHVGRLCHRGGQVGRAARGSALASCRLCCRRCKIACRPTPCACSSRRGRLLTVVSSYVPLPRSLLAFKLMPLRMLGADGWKVAAALTARHIGGELRMAGCTSFVTHCLPLGGAWRRRRCRPQTGSQPAWHGGTPLAAAPAGSVNYVAVSEALSLSPSARMAGLAADDLVRLARD